MNKRTLITGITGQIAAYLANSLLKKGYEVYGGKRRTSNACLGRLEYFGIQDKIKYVDFELLEPECINRTIEAVKPDIIINTAAQSFVKVSFEQPIYTHNVTGTGVLYILEAIRKINPKIRFLQLSSSEQFGLVQETPQNEKTPFYPRSPYGVAKLMAYWHIVGYREAYNMFASNAICFNMESELRGLEFVTRKITNTVAKIKHKAQDKLTLGNLDAKRDWSHATDSVEAMIKIIEHSKPDDFVIASGENHSIRKFVELAFNHIDIQLKWIGEGINEKGICQETNKIYVEVSEEFYRPTEVELLLGDSLKAKTELNWQPKTSFDELVRFMVEYDLKSVFIEKFREDQKIDSLYSYNKPK